MTITGTDNAIHDTTCHTPVPDKAASSPKMISTAINNGISHNRRKEVCFITRRPPAGPTTDKCR